MVSSAPLEFGEGAWLDLSRLRDISRLVLAALERDDLEAIQRLASEGNVIISRLRPVLDRHEDPPGAEFCRTLDDIARAQQRILSGLQTRKAGVAAELGRLRATRGRLRALKLPGSAGSPEFVDRQT